MANPGVELQIDVEASRLELPDGRVVEFPIDAFALYCLTQGIDQLGYLLQQSDAITSFEERRPWKP
jgi:3-isopropylmalate/(R)-2-methylmalate dehydratase small subunit